MTPGYMLDTRVCIALLRRPSDAPQARFRAEQRRIHLSTVALAELLVGPLKLGGRGQEDVDALVARLTVIPFDQAAAEHAADVRATLERGGRPIGPYDVQIAGHARSLGLVLVTRNLREFARVDGLWCEDWYAPVQGFSE